MAKKEIVKLNPVASLKTILRDLEDVFDLAALSGNKKLAKQLIEPLAEARSILELAMRPPKGRETGQ